MKTHIHKSIVASMLISISFSCGGLSPSDRDDAEFAGAGVTPLMGYVGYISALTVRDSPFLIGPLGIQAYIGTSYSDQRNIIVDKTERWPNAYFAAQVTRPHQDVDVPLKVGVRDTRGIACEELFSLSDLGISQVPPDGAPTNRTLLLCEGMIELTLTLHAENLGYDCYPPYMRSGDTCVLDPQSPVTLKIRRFELTESGAKVCDDAISGDECDVQIRVQCPETALDADTREHKNYTPSTEPQLWNETIATLTLQDLFNLAGQTLQISVRDNDTVGSDVLVDIDKTITERQEDIYDELISYDFDAGWRAHSRYEITVDEEDEKDASIWLVFEPAWPLGPPSAQNEL